MPNILSITTSLAPKSSEVTGKSFTRYMSINEAAVRITEVIQNYSETEDAQIVGASSTKRGYLIRFKNESKKQAKENPLSLNLFAFFNAELVNRPVEFSGGESAYIDDYFRWRAGPSAQQNTAKLQQEDAPRIQQWARKSRTCFETKKMELIHLKRDTQQKCLTTVTMDGAEVKPADTAKLLGVVFDQELRWRARVQTFSNQSLGWHWPCHTEHVTPCSVV